MSACELPKKNTNSKDSEAPKESCKSCVACPETRKARDECTMMVENFDEVEVKCKDLIEAHQKCMREMGFNI